MGLSGLEPPTSPLSGVRSNQLSYRPFEHKIEKEAKLLRKEVIHPHLPVRIPCYDFTPIIYHTLGNSLPKVRPFTSGATNSRGVTGGVYKTRERIHRDIADSRLLAIPTSCSRVADYNPN